MRKLVSIYKRICFLAVLVLLTTGSSSIAIESPVPGSKLGSMGSEYVANKEVWRRFPGMEKRSVEKAQVHLPEFLLDSEDAKKANAEIEKIAQKMVRHAKRQAEMDQGQGSLSAMDWNLSADFSIYQDDKILSVVVDYLIYYEFSLPKYLVYNFRLSDGKRLYDEDMAKLYGIDSEYRGIMEAAISRGYEQLTIWGSAYGSYQTYGYYEGLTLEELWDDFSPSDSRLHIDDTGKMRFKLKYYTPAGTGEFETTSSMVKYISSKDRAVSRTYTRMARELGIDPADENYKGLIIPLGKMSDELSIKAVLTRLNNWQKDYYDRDMQWLLRMDEAPGKPFISHLAGDEAYIFIPRQEICSVSMSALKTDKSGNLITVANHYTDAQRVTKPALICVNQKDNAPNSKITIRFRDDEYSFMPQINPDSGELILPAEIYNAGKLLPIRELSAEEIESSPYSYELFEKLFNMIPQE